MTTPDTTLLRAIAISIEFAADNADALVRIEAEFNGDAWDGSSRRSWDRGQQIEMNKIKLKKLWPELHALLIQVQRPSDR